MDWTILVAAATVVTAVAVVSFGLFLRTLLEQIVSSLESTRNALPQVFTETAAQEIAKGTTPLVQQMAQIASAFGQSKDQLGTVADQVGNLQTMLYHSHRTFQSVVMTLAEPGSLQEWINALQGAVQPIREIHAEVNGHYQTNERLLATAGDLLTRWSSQAASVAEECERMSGLLATWTARESTSRTEIERRIVQRLEDNNHQSNLLARNFDGLKTEVARLAQSSENLHTSFQVMQDLLGQIARGETTLVTSQQTLVEELGRSTREIARREEAAVRQLAEPVERINQISKAVERWQADLQQSVQAQIATMASNMESLSSSTAARYQQTLAGLERDHKRLQADYDLLLEQVNRLAGELPTRRHQIEQNALLILVIIASAATALVVAIVR
ncbi:MAG: hypothetical protein HY675_04225 [Chloroflexi bacterium]|nr:hypothetical protein [Chloroflexota bacterium]